MALCRDCGTSVVWVDTLHGRRMPLNPIPEPSTGRIAVQTDRRGRLFGARHITADRPIEAGETAYLTHWATCTRKARATRPDHPKTKTVQPDLPALF